MVNRRLLDFFGSGGLDRNLYCSGPMVTAFQIMPDGRVANVRPLNNPAPGITPFMVAALSTMRFPALPPGLAAQPRDEFFRYGFQPADRIDFEMFYNCR